jgi:hypothetical protein
MSAVSALGRLRSVPTRLAGEVVDGLARLLVEDFEFLDAAAQVAEFCAARRVERVELGEQIDELQRGERVEILVEDRLERGIGALRGRVRGRMLRFFGRMRFIFSSHRKS